ncbi:MAG: bifunctional DNA-formamidopyrimidine glycosylase/DNA-(apurinic or apyrimidinic site) lyase [Lentisphaeria bacterium]|nr:bifunctional DNA-formamidopyrimidine glycosylase/DNA-(apurinic or apyrimidinic site) lyase [Lentisphaeria bacterium]
MPELPEVETVRRSLEPRLLGAVIRDVSASVDNLRLPVNVDTLRRFCCGRRICALRRRAKFLVVVFDNGAGLILHLGMTGAFRIVPESTPYTVHERVAWTLSGGRSWRFADVRRFGSVRPTHFPDAGGDPPELAHLGIEPLAPAFDGAHLYRLSRGRRRPIKNLIMDQTMVVGVGNIYASEALFRAGIHPARPAGRVGRASASRLATAIREVLEEAIAAGGTTLRDFRDPDGSEGMFQVHLAVYGRQAGDCPRCGMAAGIRRVVMAGRSSFYCRGCQR